MWEENVVTIIKLSLLSVPSKTSINMSLATLSDAVKRLEDGGLTLHPAFKEALSKLYGYTSDAEGIRHALHDEPNLDHADAVFMLVMCSGFMSYLLAKANAAGIEIG